MIKKSFDFCLKYEVIWGFYKKGNEYLVFTKSKLIPFMFELFCDCLKKKAKVLDLGCGNGVHVTEQLVKQGFDVTAIDISEKMIHLAKKNVPGAKFIQISMEDIEFKNKFDGIVSSFSIHLLNERDFKITAGKIANALKCGGFFLLFLDENNHKNITYSKTYLKKIFANQGMEFLRIEKETFSTKENQKHSILLCLLQKQ